MVLALQRWKETKPAEGVVRLRPQEVDDEVRPGMGDFVLAYDKGDAGGGSSGRFSLFACCRSFEREARRAGASAPAGGACM